jgi:spore maturation protein CgeB
VEPTWNISILAVAMRWDYGIEARGRSNEDVFLVENLRPHVREVDTLWIDEHLDDPATLHRLVLERMDDTAPDVVLFTPFRDELATQTLDAVRERATSIAWFSDDQWRFDDYSSRLAPHYSVVATTDSFSVPKYEAIGVRPVLMQWAGFPTSDDRAPLPPDGPFEHDVTFIGMADPFRVWFVNQLLTNGIPVEAYGAGWPNGRVSYEEMERLYRVSRVNLNISNSRNHDVRFLSASPENQVHYANMTKDREQPKARHFEIALAGGFQLSNYYIGMEDAFTIGRDIAIYTTPEECILQVQRFLGDAEQRCAMARSAWERCRHEHTWPIRMRELLVGALGEP